MISTIRQEGYELLHDGLIELSRIEANGIRIDMDLIASTRKDLSNRIFEIKIDLEKDDVWKRWRRRYGTEAKFSKRDQLAYVFYTELKFPSILKTEKGKPSTNDEALQLIDHPFISPYLRMLKYEKALGTFLNGIEREIIDGRLHPTFNLHTVQTYRSSSTDPNFQNLPVRDKEISKIIRSLFIPSSASRVIVENDFKGIEVSVSACYHKDPNFISYITTPGKDMHRDMAAQIYCLKPSEVSKDARYGAKNKFVFPQFYGDYYVACAKNCWEWINKGKLTGPDGKPLTEHLISKGINRLGACDPEQEPVSGTFEKHVQDVEDDFWNNRFMQYGKWRKDWYHAYLNKGYFDLLTGFRIHGAFRRNAVTNYAVQGSAFHCLLWSLIQINRALRKYNMKSMVVGQIHDSLIGDVRIDELSDYLCLVEEVTTVKLRKHYDWLVVPLEIEYEICPPGGTWHDKQEVRFKKGLFYHPIDPSKFTSDAEKFVQILKPK